MRKQIITSSLLMFIYCVPVISQSEHHDLFQKNGEIYFSFEINDAEDLQWLTRIISLDNAEGTQVYAYANEEEFSNFLKSGFKYTLLPHPNEGFDPMMTNLEDMKSTTTWDAYPTYPAYVAMMYQFMADYPAICTVFSIGQTVQGRELLVAKISDNVHVDEPEPEFLYTSTMHGDEITGYVLMLRLIDSLLTSYGTSPRITSLINEMEIYINPLANPDGTYKSGNSTISGAVRYNANNVDLNRNYPDPEDGPHPDGKAWQPETISFMNFAETRNFVMSSNIHGGAEVCNYPWDTWPQLTADNTWWIYVCREYADTAQAYSPSNYMTFLNNGITNGFAWYPISGGRQDYMNYFHQCREFTLEISNTKNPPAYQLPAFWNYNKRSFLNYMEQAMYGIHGTITDAVTGLPIMAEVYIQGHDVDSSMVFSALPHGNYHRPIYAGTYTVQIKKPCYQPQIISNVVVQSKAKTLLNTQLVPGAVDFTANNTTALLNENIQFTGLSCDVLVWSWDFSGPGIPVFMNGTIQNSQNPVVQFQETGYYTVSLTVTTGSGNMTETKEDYILIAGEYLMSNSSVTTCYGLFYDSGGQNGNYTNNQDFTMTFYPGAVNGKINAVFTSFYLEYQLTCNYDWLKIYDGPNISSPLIGTYCGTDSPGNIISSHGSGALTFRFHSNNSVTAAGWAATISCALTPIETDLKVFLQGPFNGTQMDNMLPGLPDFPLQQPYAGAPWYYAGDESFATLPNPGIVDWILVEIRDAITAASADASTRIARRAGFLLTNGDVVSSDGISSMVFTVPLTKGLFPVIHHRNHLSIISSSAIVPVGGIYSYDFSGSESTVFNGAAGFSQLAPGIWGMTAGDGNTDGLVSESDLNPVWSDEAGRSGYLPGDFNLNGEATNADKNDFWLPAVGKGSQVP
ncbi:MAG: M14 family zinc carboxypeptidase [Bacteroidales bacterium]